MITYLDTNVCTSFIITVASEEILTVRFWLTRWGKTWAFSYYFYIVFFFLFYKFWFYIIRRVSVFLFYIIRRAYVRRAYPYSFCFTLSVELMSIYHNQLVSDVFVLSTFRLLALSTKCSVYTDFACLFFFIYYQRPRQLDVLAGFSRFVSSNLLLIMLQATSTLKPENRFHGNRSDNCLICNVELLYRSYLPFFYILFHEI